MINVRGLTRSSYADRCWIRGRSPSSTSATQRTESWERFDGRRTASRVKGGVIVYDANGLPTFDVVPTPVEEVPQPFDEPGEPRGEPDPCDCALAAERLRLAVMATIGTLPPRQRAVLVLRDVLSWHASKVGALRGTTVPAVNSAAQRAHAALIPIDPNRLTAATDAADGANRELAARYLAAFTADDIDGLVALSTAA